MVTIRSGEKTADGIPVGMGGQWWESRLREQFIPLDVQVSRSDLREGFTASVKRSSLDDFGLVDLSCDPCTGKRTATQVSDATEDWVVLIAIQSGREALTRAGETTLVGAGDVVLWDTRNQAEFEVLESIRSINLLIPRSALAEVSGRAWPAFGGALERDSPSVRLLVSYLSMLADSLAELPEPAVSAARNATLELFDGAVSQTIGTEDAVGSAALRLSIDAWIDGHLCDPSLSLTSVAAAHAVSARTVQRVFGRSGETFNGTVRARRLARAREELRRTNSSITSIATRWCFSDASHFSRLFKERFGTSPAAFRSRKMRS
ncbi:helix-turn-helix domain-containing protein [Rhodococcus erythropolis]|uniref:helix-turn-helix domain-containing protein n=1 Tax=Rhodococcus erythropolis TaxID=1833 RepID=UPI00197CE850|nr:helix-turn-helix domain-containing protein [Rhodococcus erythropolis]QSE42241.1 helix-turn-helix domain-containing protein [Rhodococcus erythropolis]